MALFPFASSPLRRLTTALFVLLVGIAGAPPYATSQVPCLCMASAGPAAEHAAASPLDVPLGYLAEARQAYEKVADYTCTFVKQERVRGQLLPEHVMCMKARRAPFSVYLSWRAPQAFEGQEVCFVAGRNNNQMRVHSAGLLGALGFMNLEPRDPRALENSRHTITEAGIGCLIDHFSDVWEVERQAEGTQVRITDSEFAGRPTVRVETVHPGSRPGTFYAYRSVVEFDRETHLPVDSESYDWPEPGATGGELLEAFRYLDVRLNASLEENAFNH